MKGSKSTAIASTLTVLATTNTGVANSEEQQIPVRLYGEPSSVQEVSRAKDVFKKKRIQLSLSKTNIPNDKLEELTALSLMWDSLLTNEGFKESFLKGHYDESADESQKLMYGNSEQLNLLKALISPEVKQYIEARDHKNLLLELSNLGVVKKSSYSGLKGEFKNIINNSPKLKANIKESFKKTNIDDAYRATANNACAGCHGGGGFVFIVNVAVIVNVAIELNIGIHANVAVGAALWVYGAQSAEHTLDKIANFDIDLQKEKNITLTITENSKQLKLEEMKRIANIQMTSFVDASIELGLLSITEEEKKLLITELVSKSFSIDDDSKLK